MEISAESYGGVWFLCLIRGFDLSEYLEHWVSVSDKWGGSRLFSIFSGGSPGHPLSPLPFVLVQQILSINLKAHLLSGNITGFIVG